MGLFDKFKKKKKPDQEMQKNAVSEPSVEPEKKTEEVNTANTKPGDSIADADYVTRNYNVNIGKDSSVHEVWNIYQTESGKDDKYDLFEYMEPVVEEINENALADTSDHTDTELVRMLKEIQKECDARISKIEKEKSDHNDEPDNKKNITPIDAKPILHMTKNKLRLWMIILPPLYGGENISDADVKFQIDSLSVKYGIDSVLLDKLLSEKLYMRIIQVAAGKNAVHGVNGTCKCNFSKQRNHINIREDSHGNVNYKELNMIQSVHKGDVICEMTLPTPATDGITVTGETIVGREGKYPSVPAGKNTEFNEDKTLLLAKIDGEVVYEDNKFTVRNLLTINSDVDNAVGNIDFTGDVFIKGDVREGYSVKAEGDVRITGTVEGSTVIVGGDLQIDRGMTGGNKGVIEVQGHLKCKYLENCKVYAKEGVEADQIVYCTLSTDKDIVLKGKKGSVTGGRLIAGGTVDAVSIGSVANTTLKTEIVLGVIPHLIEKEKELRQRLEVSQDQLAKMTQDITYINSNIQHVNDERKELLKKLLFQYQVDQMKTKKLEAELEAVTEKIQQNTEKSGLKCSHVYPILNLSVRGLTQVIDKEILECRVVMKDGKAYVSGSNLGNMIVF